jgi:hypothetical protein
MSNFGASSPDPDSGQYRAFSQPAIRWGCVTSWGPLTPLAEGSSAGAGPPQRLFRLVVVRITVKVRPAIVSVPVLVPLPVLLVTLYFTVRTGAGVTVLDRNSNK